MFSFFFSIFKYKADVILFNRLTLHVSKLIGNLVHEEPRYGKLTLFSRPTTDYPMIITTRACRIRQRRTNVSFGNQSKTDFLSFTRKARKKS